MLQYSIWNIMNDIKVDTKKRWNILSLDYIYHSIMLYVPAAGVDYMIK